jgi:hypothetical protein
MKTTSNSLLIVAAIIAVLAQLAYAQWTGYDAEPNWQSDYDGFTTSVALAELDKPTPWSIMDPFYLDMITACYDYPYQFNVYNPSQMEGGNWGDHVYVYPGTAAGLSNQRIQITSVARGNECLCVCDFNNDGHLDIAVGTLALGKGPAFDAGLDGKVYVLFNGGSGTIQSRFFDDNGQFSPGHPHRWIANEVCDVHNLRAVDLDCDGDLDLAAEEIGGIVRFYENTGGNNVLSSVPVLFSLNNGNTTTTYQDPTVTERDNFTHTPLNTTLAGTVMEFGDIDFDGDPDMCINTIGSMPQVLKNLMTPTTPIPVNFSTFNFFDVSEPGNYFYNPTGNHPGALGYAGHENINCASFGYYHGNGIDTGDTLALAIGSFDYRSPACMEWNSHQNKLIIDPRGNNVYALYNDNSLRNLWISEYNNYDFNTNTFTGPNPDYQQFQMVTDIQWADLNYDGIMDLVTCAYPPAQNIGETFINWSTAGGREKVYLATANGTLPSTPSSAIWTSNGNDLSTSLALGDINGSNQDAYNHFVSLGNDPSIAKSLHYLPNLPTYVYSVWCRRGSTDDVLDITDDDWCFDPVNGWVSISRNYLHNEIPNWWWASGVDLIFWYVYSPHLDLVIGNDGKDVAYYYNGVGNNYTSNAKNYQAVGYIPSPVKGYSENLATAQMDPVAPIGMNLLSHNSDVATEFVQDCPDVKAWSIGYGWESVESLWRHFYWGSLDKIMDVAAVNNRTIMIYSFFGQPWTQGLWIPNLSFQQGDFLDEKFMAYFSANLVNRYRPGGIKNYSNDWGVRMYLFTNEPSLPYNTTPGAPRPVSIDPIVIGTAEQMFRNYQMIHGIDPTGSMGLKLVSPNFCGHYDGNINRAEVDYLNALNQASIPSVSPPYDVGALANYSDIICQQMYVADNTISPPGGGNDEWLDPLQGNNAECVRRLILDYYEGDGVNPAPLTLTQERPHMVNEYEYSPSPCGNNRMLAFNNVLFDTRNKQATNSSEQPLVRYSLRSTYYDDWWAGNSFTDQNFRRTLNTQAHLLNGTSPIKVVESGPNGYDKAYYTLNDPSYAYPWPMTGYDFVYNTPSEPPDDPDYVVHCVRTASTIPTADQKIAVQPDIQRTSVWDNNGFYVDRDISTGTPDYVTIHPGEADSLTLMVTEYFSGIPTQVHQGIQLIEGWNLVSFNIKDDPNPVNDYYIREIFGGPPTEPYGEGYPWFTYQITTGDDGPDRVYNYLHGPHSPVYFPKTTPENTWFWPWNMTWAYMVKLGHQHFIELAADNWYADELMTFTPSSAWDDSLGEGLPQTYEEATLYWFFLGLPKSRQIQVLPADETLGPFYHLYGDVPNGYTSNRLLVVKSDDGRCFLPNPTWGGSDIDRLGYLEPGRGYSLGFVNNRVVTNWPFCSGIPEESLGPGGSTQKGGEQSQISSLQPDPVHFQFKSRTQWWYPIMIDTFAIAGVTPAPGDEIGVFDASLCVGAVVFQDSLPVIVPAWKDDISTPDTTDGYTVGHEIVFKYFDQSENAEIVFELPPQIQSVPEENLYAPTHSGFGAGAYAIRSLAQEGVVNVTQLPKEFHLGQNYPNPFNAQTIIPIDLPQRSHVKIELFNLQGQSLGVIYEGTQNAGSARIGYEGSRLTSGIYFLRVQCEGLERSGKFQSVSKLVLLK